MTRTAELPSRAICRDLLQVYRQENGLNVGQYAVVHGSRDYRAYVRHYGVSANFLWWAQRCDDPALQDLLESLSLKDVSTMDPRPLQLLANHFQAPIRCMPTNIHVWEVIRARYPLFNFTIRDDPRHFGVKGFVSFVNWPTCNGVAASTYLLVTGQVQASSDPLPRPSRSSYRRKVSKKGDRWMRW